MKNLPESLDAAPGWRDILRQPADGDHIAQVYRDEAFLAEAVSHFVAEGLRCGEGIVVVATPAHWQEFARWLEAAGFGTGGALESGQIQLLDAEQTLSRFMIGGMPDWEKFRDLAGGLIRRAASRYPKVRAFGEMVDLLWRRGEQEAAVRLEGFWNDLARRHRFSLFCAYSIDNLEPAAYGGPLECVCRSHTHLIAARDYGEFNQAVMAASTAVLGPSLAGVLAAAAPLPALRMPAGQRTLLQLTQCAPLAAGEVIEQVKMRLRELARPERRASEQALRESERRYRQLFEQASDGIFLVDHSGRFLLANSAGCKMLGYTREELLQRALADTYVPGERGMANARLAEFAAGQDLRLERLMRRKDGSTVPVEINAGALEAGCYHVIVRDLTLRKQTERALQESGERFRQFAENINEVMFLATPALDKLIYVSPAYELLWGKTCASVYASPRSWQESVHAEDMPEVLKSLRAMRQSGRFQLEFRIQHPGGGMRWMRVRGFPIRDESGALMRVGGIAEDVTERVQALKEAEQTRDQLRKLAAHLDGVREDERERISRGLHDELGSMLTLLKLELSWVAKRPGKPPDMPERPQAPAVQMIDRAMQTVRRICNDLRPSLLDDMGFWAAVEWEAGQLAERSKIRCEVVADPSVRAAALDRRQSTALFRIVQEALTNAVRHGRPSTIRIDGRIRGNMLVVRVVDDGSGIPRRALRRRGALGLLGMQERALAVGGTLKVERARRGGTVVAFRLALENRREAPAR